MSCIEDLKEKFYAYENAMKACLPKVDPKLVTEILQWMKREEKPMYTIEIFLNKNTNIEQIRERVAKETGEVATFYDDGYHMVAAHRVTLEMLEEISKNDDVDEIKGTHVTRGTASIGPVFERTKDEEYWEGQRD
ncbi:MAG: hypothetical protein ACTHKF_07690 [Candidatus Nitrosocosmicus sp.]